MMYAVEASLTSAHSKLEETHSDDPCFVGYAIQHLEFSRSLEYIDRGKGFAPESDFQVLDS